MSFVHHPSRNEGGRPVLQDNPNETGLDDIRLAFSSWTVGLEVYTVSSFKCVVKFTHLLRFSH